MTSKLQANKVILNKVNLKKRPRKIASSIDLKRISISKESQPVTTSIWPTNQVWNMLPEMAGPANELIEAIMARKLTTTMLPLKKNLTNSNERNAKSSPTRVKTESPRSTTSPHFSLKLMKSLM